VLPLLGFARQAMIIPPISAGGRSDHQPLAYPPPLGFPMVTLIYIHTHNTNTIHHLTFGGTHFSNTREALMSHTSSQESVGMGFSLEPHKNSQANKPGEGFSIDDGQS
jgi:hypothetical protein